MRLLAVDLGPGIDRAWTNVVTFVPKLVVALLILIVGLIVARVVAGLLDKILERVGFDRAVERGAIREALARSKYDPSDILSKLVFWALVLITLQLALGVFGPNPISDALNGIIAYLPNIFVAIVILVIAAFLARGARDLLGALLSGAPAGQALATGAMIAILVLGVFMALNQLHIAEDVVLGLWYAILAIVVGSAVVAIGGGGIRTMQRYWERAAGRVEAQAPQYRDQVQRQRAAAPGYGDRRAAHVDRSADETLDLTDQPATTRLDPTQPPPRPRRQL